MGLIADTLNRNALRDQVINPDAVLSTGFMGEFAKGLDSGTTGIHGGLRAMGGTIAEAMGADELAQSQYQRARELQARAQTEAPRVNSYKQVLDDPTARNALHYMGGILGGSAPSIGLGMGAGMLARTALGGIAAGTAALTPIEAGDVAMKQLNDPEAMQTDPLERFGRQAAGGAASSVLQTAVPSWIGGKLVGRGAEQAAKQTIGQIVGRNALAVPAEGVFEGGSDALKQYASNDERALDWDSIKENFAGGIAAGGALSGVGTVGDLASRNVPMARNAIGTAYDAAQKQLTRGKTFAGEQIDNVADSDTWQFISDIADTGTKMATKAWDAASEVAKAMAPDVQAKGEKVAAFLKESAETQMSKIDAWKTDIMASEDISAELKKQFMEAAKAAPGVARNALLASIRFASESMAKAKAASKDHVASLSEALSSPSSDPTLDAIADGLPLDPVNEQQGAEGQQANDQTAVQKAMQWGQELIAMGDKLSTEARSSLEEHLKNVQNPIAQRAIAGMKRMYDAAGKKVEQFNAFAQAQWDGMGDNKADPDTKQSADYSGIEKVISEKLIPWFQKNSPQSLDPNYAVGAVPGQDAGYKPGGGVDLKQVGAQFRRLLSHTYKQGRLVPPPAGIKYALFQAFGDDAMGLMGQMHEAMKQTSDDALYNHYTALTNLAADQKAYTNLVKLIAKSTPEGGPVNAESVAANLLEWATKDTGSRARNAEPDKVANAKTMFQSTMMNDMMAKRFGPDARRIMKALEAEATRQRDVYGQEQSIAQLESDGNVNDDEVVPDYKDTDDNGEWVPPQVADTERVFYGRGARTNSTPFLNPKLYDPKQGHAKWQYGIDRTAEAKANHPDGWDVRWRSEHELEMGDRRKTHGYTVAEKAKASDGLTDEDYRSMMWDTERYGGKKGDANPSRLRIGDYSLDATKIGIMGKKHMQRNGYPATGDAQARKNQALMHGVAQLMLENPTFKMPDTAVVWQDGAQKVTFGQIKNLGKTTKESAESRKEQELKSQITAGEVELHKGVREALVKARPADGSAPNYALSVVEHQSIGYRERTKHNADSAGVTVAVATNYETPGERLTKSVSGSKYLAIPLDVAPDKGGIRLARAMRQAGTTTLNVAGNSIDTLSPLGHTQASINQHVYDMIAAAHELLPITRIVTGGQTGVDIAGAVAAHKLGIPVTVTMPRGFLQRDAAGKDARHTAGAIQGQITEGALAISGIAALEGRQQQTGTYARGAFADLHPNERATALEMVQAQDWRAAYGLTDLDERLAEVQNKLKAREKSAAERDTDNGRSLDLSDTQDVDPKGQIHDLTRRAGQGEDDEHLIKVSEDGTPLSLKTRAVYGKPDTLEQRTKEALIDRAEELIARGNERVNEFDNDGYAANKGEIPKNPKPGSVVQRKVGFKLSAKTHHVTKDQRKANLATAFIGVGSAASSTNQYAEDAAKQGMPANEGKYTSKDVVFISAEGLRGSVKNKLYENGRSEPYDQNDLANKLGDPKQAVHSGRISPDFDEIQRAMNARATLLTDIKLNRDTEFNLGEREVARYLSDNGYTETKPGRWEPKPTFTEKGVKGYRTADQFAEKEGSAYQHGMAIRELLKHYGNMTEAEQTRLGLATKGPGKDGAPTGMALMRILSPLIKKYAPDFSVGDADTTGAKQGRRLGFGESAVGKPARPAPPPSQTYTSDPNMRAKPILADGGDARKADGLPTGPVRRAPSPKAVAAKKAALVEKAASGDKGLISELSTSTDAKGLQRAAEALMESRVSDQANMRYNNPHKKLVAKMVGAINGATRAQARQNTVISDGLQTLMTARLQGDSDAIAAINHYMQVEHQMFSMERSTETNAAVTKALNGVRVKSLDHYLGMLIDAKDVPYAFKEIARAIQKVGTSTTVVGVAKSALMNGEFAHHDAVRDQIVIDKSLPFSAQVLLHEAVHAATYRSILKDAELNKALVELMNHVADHDKQVATAYGMTNSAEFLAEGLSNRAFQKHLQQIPASSAVRAYLGDTIANAWEGFVALVRMALKLDARHDSALSQMFELASRAMEATQTTTTDGDIGSEYASWMERVVVPTSDFDKSVSALKRYLPDDAKQELDNLSLKARADGGATYNQHWVVEAAAAMMKREGVTQVPANRIGGLMRFINDSSSLGGHKKAPSGIGDALDTIKKRLGELMQNEDVAYGMQTRRYKLSDTLDMLESKLKGMESARFEQALEKYNVEGPVRGSQGGWGFKSAATGEEVTFGEGDDPNTGHYETAENARQALLAEMDYADQQSTGRKYSLQSAEKATSSNQNADQFAQAKEYLDRSVPWVRQQLADLMHAGDYTETANLIRLSKLALNPQSTAYHESLHAFFADLRKNGRDDVIAVLQTMADSPSVRMQMRDFFSNELGVLRQLNSDPEERAAVMYQMWAAGKLKVGPKTQGLFERIKRFIAKLLGHWTADEHALHIMEYLNTGAYAENRTAPNVVYTAMMAKGMPQVWAQTKQLAKPLANMAETIVGAGSENLRDTGIPALAELANMVKRRGIDEGDDVGFTGASREAHVRYANKLGALTEGATESEMRSALQALQTGKSATGKAEAIRTGVRGLLDEMYDYLHKAGVNTADLGLKKDYFPRHWDPSYLVSHKQEFMDMARNYPQWTDPEETYQRLVGDMGSEMPTVDRPGMAANKRRLLSFISHKDAAPFMEKDLLQIMNGYITQATRRSEWSRRFQDDNSGLEALLDTARGQGATTDQIKEAKRFVEGVNGTLGDDLNPTARRMMGDMIVYQNVRLLPLAIFSSVVDPMGVVVRGGSISDAWGVFKRAVGEIPKGLRGDTRADELTRLAQDLEVVTNASLQHALGTTFNQGVVGKTGQKINDAFFRFNLMEQWNTSVRVGATQAALGFIGKHADGSGKHSARYMRELGLQNGDVKLVGGRVATSTSEGLTEAQAGRVKAAVNQWVDGAVLRPDAADSAVWMNDPHFILISHLKKFAYAFHHTILKRVVHEFKNGNYMPAVALTSYIPIMLAADMLKGMLQGGGDTPEWKKNWAAADYLMNATERAGVFGVGQFGVEALHGNWGALTGPTIEQLTDAVEVMGGRKSMKSFVTHAMPANALYSTWAKEGANDTFDNPE